jgi:hypothetical protein
VTFLTCFTTLILMLAGILPVVLIGAQRLLIPCFEREKEEKKTFEFLKNGISAFLKKIIYKECHT